MNKALLKAVAERIIARPENYNQNQFCGTVCCIAGHVALMTGIDIDPYKDYFSSLRKIQQLLELTNKQWGDLCLFAFYWPKEFADKWENTVEPAGRAQVAYDRIMHMIRTGE